MDRRALQAALDAHGPLARVVVAATKGSAPREAGADMLVWKGGQDGTIGGGTLEWEAARAARRVLAEGAPPRLARHALGPDMGQCCGGAVWLVTEALRAAPPPGPRRLPLGPAPAPGPSSPAPALGLGVRLEGGCLLETVTEGPAERLVIWGAGHVGRALAATLAPLRRWEVLVADAPARLDPAPAGLPLPAADLPALARTLPPDAHHLVVTHSHDLDLALCDALLRRGFLSCGLIGSATKRARFDRRLSALGHAAPFERILCPIGDRRLGKHPQAIAIGVAATMLDPAGAGGLARAG
ncbi:molybdenum cofactor sulfurylase [Hasllibacter halocynthiae]|uniref:Molybdenum cofactor sulfurylase n=1 Tax=Hasllibacter halocynthiae TaxID=595589 RepID=A0A2T0X129_9RHOB|nr:xanthine dehydrogenase accessory protein XdhC [Hasllibacter halocynthiae]PRY92641.1 molybdenum cofactor sulfurylase [Hasllibacter halocynthiae]